MTASLLAAAFAASLATPHVVPLTSAPSGATQNLSGYGTDARGNRTNDVAAMLTALNGRRAAKGLAPLALDENLSQVAVAHAADMVARNYFDHFTPEGLSPFQRLDRAHISYGYAGENLALDRNTAAAELALWESREHRDNILGAHYAKVGIAAVQGPQGEIFVEDFSD